MPQLLIGLLVLFLAIQFFRLMARTPPATIARYIRGAGGLGSFAGGVLMFLRGKGVLGAALSLLGAWLSTQAARSGPFSAAGAGRTQRVSRVQTPTLDMVLDLDSGAMTGTVVAGAHAGRSLDSFSREDMVGLLKWMQAADAEGVRLLEAYLDRIFPGWRTADEAHAHTGAESGRRSRARAMSEEEAYQVLGLLPGAPREEIVRAHRTLMKQIHPDHGGATDLAARVNEARDVLIRRHP